MPHIILKLVIGRTEQQKQALARKLADAVMDTIGSGDEAISVAIEDVPMSEWTEKVYRPDIIGRSATLYKKPGYDPLA